MIFGLRLLRSCCRSLYTSSRLDFQSRARDLQRDSICFVYSMLLVGSTRPFASHLHASRVLCFSCSHRKVPGACCCRLSTFWRRWRQRPDLIRLRRLVGESRIWTLRCLYIKSDLIYFVHNFALTRAGGCTRSWAGVRFRVFKVDPVTVWIAYWRRGWGSIQGSGSGR